MPHPLEELRESALGQIAQTADSVALENVRVQFLGRAGSIAVWGEQMKSLSKEEKPLVGKLLNEARTTVAAAIEKRATEFRGAAEASALANIDITLPGTPHEIGAIHPLTQMLERAIAIFRR